jgi:ribonuclease Z
MLDLCLLGCGGSMPVPYRYLTSLLLNYKGRKLLIDCGEGTQVSMKMVSWGFKSIDTICITHTHADHVVGLPGLLLTIANSDRTEPITIIGPIGLQKVVAGLTVLFPYLPFELEVIEVPEHSSAVFNFQDIDITAFSVDHTLPCLGYSFNIKRGKRFDVDTAKENNIPVFLWNKLQKGETVIHEDREYTPNMVLGEERHGIKLSYFTDTRPFPGLIDYVQSSDLLIAEGMYGDDSHLEKAESNKHMLFSEAAKVALHSKSKELWLTHFSPSLTEPELYLDFTKAIFNNTILGEDRLMKTLFFES